MKSWWRDDNGFTLLELLVALPLAALILTAVLMLLRLGTAGFEAGLAGSDAHYALRHIRGSVIQDIVAGQRCEVLSRPNGAPLAAGQSGRYLKIYGEEAPGGRAYTVLYYAEEGQFYRVKNAATPLAEKVRAAAFTELEHGLIAVEITAGSGEDNAVSKFKCGTRVQ